MSIDENRLSNTVAKAIESRLMPVIDRLLGAIKKTQDDTRMTQHGLTELADRVRTLEVLVERQRDDISWLLRAECEKKDPINSPWRTISTR